MRWNSIFRRFHFVGKDCATTAFFGGPTIAHDRERQSLSRASNGLTLDFSSRDLTPVVFLLKNAEAPNWRGEADCWHASAWKRTIEHRRKTTVNNRFSRVRERGGHDELLMNLLKAAFVWGNAGIAQLVQSG
jgi:hypothetical protein